MKRTLVIKHLNAHGCRFEREGGNHSVWLNPLAQCKSPVPRHHEIPFRTVLNICKQLKIPPVTKGR